jgi:c(7)-type cytochrome triheme protein
MADGLGRSIVALAAAVAGAVALGYAGGGARADMARVFEPQTVHEVVRHARRPPYFLARPAPVVVEQLPPPTDWSFIYAGLPKDANGNVNWVAALASDAISPAPGPDPATEEQPVLDLDIELVPADMPELKVIYPHAIHTKLLGCQNCHMEIFQMERGADPITMEKILAGEYCGRCHGKVAFDPTTACDRCHKALAQ